MNRLPKVGMSGRPTDFTGVTATGSTRPSTIPSMSARVRVAAVVCLALAACNSNTAPGNDREAWIDGAPTAAETMPAGAAIAGVETALLHPEIMTDADLGTLEPGWDRCTFRMTKVGFPVFVFPPSGTAAGIVKLNGRLMHLEGAGNGRFASDGVDVTLRPLDEGATDGVYEAAFVLRLPGAANELGYHGFAEC